MQKKTESRSRFTAELTEDRELERDQFERAMEKMRNEIDQVRDAAKSEALLAQKVVTIICYIIPRIIRLILIRFFKGTF